MKKKHILYKKNITLIFLLILYVLLFYMAY